MIKFRAWDNECKVIRYYDELKGLTLDTLDASDFKLEQFTGLQDVDGKEIYEGDIARYTRWADHVGIVRYFKPEFELQNIGLDIDIAPTLTMRHELRVIGNVHENPELLEADTND
ncbi:hypothetical protein C4O30_16115 [Lactiplantibacillus plantarum]|nr:hypothetical protein C4O30_00230 [Lactiplantibacillus plantarum]AVE84518.1 hypothetical protein C4O30_16115 [Lactiplantibacillus plantarum]